MKKIFFLFLFGLAQSIVNSQEIPDAVRYANNDLNGTARFIAMSGAFGALGGDFSSINVNPAAGAIFLRSQMGFTVNNNTIKNNTDYYGSNYNNCNSSFDFNQAGTIFVLNAENPNNDWKKVVFGINYENVNNFDNALFSYGTNPNTSVANYFLSYAKGSNNQNGIPLNILQNSYYNELNYQDQQAFLGYQGYIINPLKNNPENTIYYSNVPSGGNYYQENYLVSSGYNGKLNINFATQYKEKFFIGMNLNSHFTDYYQYTSFYESNNNSKTQGVKNLFFENDLYTYGYGFSFQVGAIAKLSNNFRFGLAYESPTWYQLNDQLLQTLSSTGFNYGTPPDPKLSSTIVDSNYIMIYQPYDLQTPGKVTTSFAYVYGKKGLISFDYIYKDYSNTKYTSGNNTSGINQALNNTLDVSYEFRIGAEYRIKQLSLRGGYRFEGSPYENKQTMGDLNGISTGLGYSFGPAKIDFAYAYSHRTSQQASFSQGFNDSAYVNTENNNYTLTLLFDF